MVAKKITKNFQPLSGPEATSVKLLEIKMTDQETSLMKPPIYGEKCGLLLYLIETKHCAYC